MLERANTLRESTAEDDQLVDFDWLIAAARRQSSVFIICCVAALLLGAANALTAVPLYTASTDILIDQRRAGAIDEAQDVRRPINDMTTMDSEVEVLRSEKVASRAVDQLDLTNNAAFMYPPSRGLSQGIWAIRSLLDVRNWFKSEELPTEASPEALARRKQIAIERLQAGMSVERLLRTSVLRVRYTSPDPQLAAKITDAIAESYLTDQLESKYEATRRAGGWLQQRIEELRQNSMASDLAVQRYKSDNGLIGADGRLLNDQQLAELTSQLMVASSNTARAEARYRQINAIVESGKIDAAVTESLDSNVINNIRTKYLDASKRMSQLTQTVGPDHLQVVRLRDDLREYERLIFDELRRIAETYESEYKVAQSQEQTLQRSVDRLMGISASTNETLVTLRELERNSEIYRNLYENFLQRYQESMQRESFPITEGRVINRARVPNSPSHPKIMLILAASLAFGAVAGTGIGALREYRDRVFRTSGQVRDELTLEFIGMLATVPEPVDGAAPRADKEPRPVEGGRLLVNTPPIMRHVLEAPLSSFAETLRAAKVAAMVTLSKRKPRVIGITSALPGEGKSVVSKNLATLLAGKLGDVLLIDADLRNPGLTKSLIGKTDKGLLDVIVGRESLFDLVHFETDTHLAFLPCGSSGRVTHSSDLLASPGMEALLEEAGRTFKYIVVDLPPMGPIIDVRAIEPQIGAFLFVIEWGNTPRKVVRNILETDRPVWRKCIGAVFNKVDMDRVHLYENSGSPDHYHRRYVEYYRN